VAKKNKTKKGLKESKLFSRWFDISIIGKFDKKNTGRRLKFKTGICDDGFQLPKKNRAVPLFKGRGWQAEFSRAKKPELIIAADNFLRAEDAFRLFVCAITLEQQSLYDVDQDEYGRRGWQPKHIPFTLAHEKSPNKKESHWVACAAQLAVSVIKEIMLDPNASPQTRLTAARDALDRLGWVPPKRAEIAPMAPAQRSPESLTREELEEIIRRGEQAEREDVEDEGGGNAQLLFIQPP